MQFIIYFLVGKLFALFIGAYYYKYLSRPYKLVLYLIAIAAFCECYGYYLVKILKQNSNAWVFNCYVIVDVWILGTAAVYLVNNLKIKKLFIGSLILNTLIWVINVAVNSIYKFANIFMVCGLAFLTVTYIIVLFSGTIFKEKNILKQPVFWLSLSTILYCACDIPCMGLNSYLFANSPEIGLQFYNINQFLDIIRYPLVAISFILLGRQKQGALKTV